MSAPEIIDHPFDGVLLLRNGSHLDERGLLTEIFDSRDEIFPVFNNSIVSRSRRRVIRGLHFQWPEIQSKLVTVVSGGIFDVIVDVRRDSPTFGQHKTFELYAENARQLWIGPGFAHGYQAILEDTVVHYCVTNYSPRASRRIHYADTEMAIKWPLTDPIVSAEDQGAMSFEQWKARET